MSEHRFQIVFDQLAKYELNPETKRLVSEIKDTAKFASEIEELKKMLEAFAKPSATSFTTT